jgi:hypothetical protein
MVHRGRLLRLHHRQFPYRQHRDAVVVVVAPLLANTGQQAGTDWVAVPAALSSGGASFQTWFVPQSEQGPNQPVLP